MTRQQCMCAGLILAALAMFAAGILQLATRPIPAVLWVLMAWMILVYAIAGFAERLTQHQSDLGKHDGGRSS